MVLVPLNVVTQQALEELIPELKALLGGNGEAIIRNALRFVLAQDISVVVPGLKSVREVEIVAKVGDEFKGLTDEEKKRFEVQLGNDYCRDCGFCLPCPEGLNIPAILRFHDLSAKYGLKIGLKSSIKDSQSGQITALSVENVSQDVRMDFP